VPAGRFEIVVAVFARDARVAPVLDDLTPAFEHEQPGGALRAVEYLADAAFGKIDAVQALGELLD
jgi:hypothetical protein